jgi:hypothetical protein
MKISNKYHEIIKLKNNRILREKNTIDRMIAIYCKNHNKNESLCDVCEAILEYVHHRIESCRFGACKPACSRCNVYCYHNEMKSRMKRIMKYSGPRMAIYHPILSIFHFQDVISSRQ